MQIVFNGDSLHEVSNPVFRENKKTISVCICCIKFSANDIEIFFLIFYENRFSHFMQVVSNEMSNPVFWEKKEKKRK